MTNDDKTQVANIACVMAGTGMYQTFAVVGALAESRLIDPIKVAAWAEFFAENQTEGFHPEIREAIRGHMLLFAASLRALSLTPPSAGSG